MCEKDYKRGFIDACRQFAKWKDGEQVVGIQEKSLSEMIQNIEDEIYYQYEIPNK